MLPIPEYFPVSEGSHYHDHTRAGYFILGYSTAAGRQCAHSALRAKEAGQKPNHYDLSASYRQRAFPLKELYRVLGNPYQHLAVMPANDTDVWLSQAEFTRPNRQKIHLGRVQVCWVDIDLHHENTSTKLRSLCSEKALALVHARIADRGLPPPSIILWTGRGLAVKWYLAEALPKAAYPRWSAVQSALVEAFADLGGDAQARDASRILRLVSTFNHKSGTVCEPIWARTFFGEVEHVSFDSLADAVLPLTRAQLTELRAKRAAAALVKKQYLQHRLCALEGGKTASTNLVKFNPIRLAWLQLDDYRKLAALRPVYQRPEGWTNALVWMATSALAMAVWADADRWENELPVLCRELAPHWPASRIAQSTAAVKVRMGHMARGEWTDWQGTRRPPIYTPRHTTILATLGVTDAEAEQLDVIIPADLARERARARDRKRNEQYRRSAGGLSREQWLASHEQRRATARLLRASGKTWRVVAEECGYPSAKAALMACH